MFSSLFGAQTRIGNLRWSLDDSSRAHKAIAGRVAGALDASGNTDFDQALAGQADTKPNKPKVDIEKEMVDLASTQLRYDASAKLLSAAYQGLRTALKNNG
jgi:flagellar basal body rod protein FlgB